MSKSDWIRAWGDGWAFDDPRDEGSALAVYQADDEWTSVVQCEAGADTDDIEARVIARLAARVRELEAAVLDLVDWFLDDDTSEHMRCSIPDCRTCKALESPVVRELIEGEGK